jgi:hypothetical protein
MERQASNCDPNAPGGLSEDRMDYFDQLPPAVRAYIASSIASWNSRQILEAYRWAKAAGMEPVGFILSTLKKNEKIQHDAAVKAGVIPKVENYAFEIRALRGRNSARRIQAPGH